MNNKLNHSKPHNTPPIYLSYYTLRNSSNLIKQQYQNHYLDYGLYFRYFHKYCIDDIP